jgi:hydrogenase maturation protein HypF
MAQFSMCIDCAAEYQDPTNRRFHAQPIACPVCGPYIWLEKKDGVLAEREDALQEARRLLADGKIVAIKGLGGFHLACDATNDHVVGELRRRKLRVDKPFALMVPDLTTMEKYCLISDADKALAQSIERPIVISERRTRSSLSHHISPGQNTLGLMLPYTPLHYLIIEPKSDFPDALVMTSGNISEEPIATTNEEARQNLSPLADAFLMHNRDIHLRCDDSVVHPFHQQVYSIRRARGYAPMPIHLPWKLPELLAVGAELKNTFCLTRGNYAFMSHHIGNLENYETLKAFEAGITHFERLFRIRPKMLAYDLHPDYLATRYALERAEREDLPALGIQHHHAHIAACMAENGISNEDKVAGISFDGTGYGEDGAIWGGEVLLVSYSAYQRLYHLEYSPLPGGNLAIKEPWRLALTWLHKVGISWQDDLPPLQYIASQPDHMLKLNILQNQILGNINAIPTSSMGRLFDAVAALLGIRQIVNYEAQAAIELEAQAAQCPQEKGLYPITIENGVIDPGDMITSIVSDLRAGNPIPKIAARFQNSIAAVVLEMCQHIRRDQGIKRIALSGGVWQNLTLLTRTVNILKSNDFDVYTHSNIPANDGGLALGQALIAVQWLKDRK